MADGAKISALRTVGESSTCGAAHNRPSLATAVNARASSMSRTGLCPSVKAASVRSGVVKAQRPSSVRTASSPTW